MHFSSFEILIYSAKKLIGGLILFKILRFGYISPLSTCICRYFPKNIHPPTFSPHLLIHSFMFAVNVGYDENIKFMRKSYQKVFKYSYTFIHSAMFILTNVSSTCAFFIKVHYHTSSQVFCVILKGNCSDLKTEWSPNRYTIYKFALNLS